MMLSARFFISVCMILGYVLLRHFFNQWDKKIKITKKEIIFTYLFFSFVSVLLNDKMSFIIYISVYLNIICLTFLGFVDSKTGLLYTALLHLLIIFNGIIYSWGFMQGYFQIPMNSIPAIIIYMIVVLLLCYTSTIAVGDGKIYLIQLLLLMTVKNGDSIGILLLIGLIYPLLSFVSVEGGRMLFIWFKNRHKKRINVKINTRRPFAPYLLFGLILSLLLYLF